MPVELKPSPRPVDPNGGQWVERPPDRRFFRRCRSGRETLWALGRGGNAVEAIVQPRNCIVDTGTYQAIVRDTFVSDEVRNGPAAGAQVGARGLLFGCRRKMKGPQASL